MKLIIDAQLPPALAAWMAAQGLEALHVQDVALRESSDADIWAYACAHGAIIVTKDEDFAQLAGIRPSPPRILLVRLGNTTNPNLIRAFEARWSDIISHFQSGATLVELR